MWVMGNQICIFDALLPNKLTAESFAGAIADHTSGETLEGCDKPNSNRLKYKRIFMGLEFGNAKR